MPATIASQGPPTHYVLRRGSLLLLRFERRLVEPEVVATSPCPGKSRVPVCCGFDSMKLVLAAGVAPALATLSTSCVCVGLREQSGRSLQPVMLRQEFFTKEVRRLLHGGGNGDFLRA